MSDTILTSFPRLDGETDDSPRIQRAIDATPNGILCIPKGDYTIAKPLFIKTRCATMWKKTLFSSLISYKTPLWRGNL